MHQYSQTSSRFVLSTVSDDASIDQGVVHRPEPFSRHMSSEEKSLEANEANVRIQKRSSAPASSSTPKKSRFRSPFLSPTMVPPMAVNGIHPIHSDEYDSPKKVTLALSPPVFVALDPVLSLASGNHSIVSRCLGQTAFPLLDCHVQQSSGSTDGLLLPTVRSNLASLPLQSPSSRHQVEYQDKPLGIQAVTTNGDGVHDYKGSEATDPCRT